MISIGSDLSGQINVCDSTYSWSVSVFKVSLKDSSALSADFLCSESISNEIFSDDD